MVIKITKAVATIIHAVSPLLGTGAGAAAGAAASAAGAAAAAAAAAGAAGGASAMADTLPMIKLNPSKREDRSFFIMVLSCF
jgi:hypothetical protein